MNEEVFNGFAERNCVEFHQEEARRVATGLWKNGRARLNSTRWREGIYGDQKPLMRKVGLAGKGLVAELVGRKSMVKVKLQARKHGSRLLVY